MSRLAHWASDLVERWQPGAPRWVGPTGEIGLSLFLRWEPEGLFMIVNLYIDESYNQDIFILGGYIAKLGQWNSFDYKWNRLLKKYQIRYFHSTEMVDRDGDFAKWNHNTEIAFCSEAEELSRKHGLCGFVSRIDFADYREHYRTYKPVKGFNLDSIYGLAFRYIIGFVPDFVERSFRRNDIVINGILENSQYFGDGLRVWNDIKKRVPEVGRLLGTAIPGDKKIPGLQSADALATGAYRLERVGEMGFTDFPQAVVTLSDLRKRKLSRPPVVRCHPTPEQLRDIKDAAQEGKEYRRSHAERARAARKAILTPEPDSSVEPVS
jgi:hypothetical protein